MLSIYIFRLQANTGLKLQEELKPYFNEKMRELATRAITILTNSDLQLRLRGGKFSKLIYLKMSNRITLV